MKASKKKIISSIQLAIGDEAGICMFADETLNPHQLMWKENKCSEAYFGISSRDITK